MSKADEAKAIIHDISDKNVDEIVRASSFTNEVEESIRGHIHQELTSWMFYRKLAGDCSRANIALHGFALLWERSAAECLADAFWLEKYLIQRGGRCRPTDIEAPKIEWSDNPVEPVKPVLEAVNTEKRLLEDLERLCCLGTRCGNNSLADMIETRFLRKESKHVKDLCDLLQQVVRVSKAPGHGLFHLDAELRRHDGCLPWAKSNDPNNIDLSLSEVAMNVEQCHLGSNAHCT